jgi:hypothetical protein
MPYYQEHDEAFLQAQGLSVSHRMRNYEIEHRLRNLPGVLGGNDWIVAELCFALTLCVG